MDFNLILCIVFAVLMCIIVPIVCYIFCNNNSLKKFRNLLLVFYIIALFIGVTAQIKIDGNVVSVNYEFTKIWGNKEMFWGFENLTTLTIILNLVMLMPLGSYLASANTNKKWWQTVLFACVVGMFVSLFIETLQYCLPIPRVIEFSDTLFNTISCGLGALMIVIFKKARNKMQKKLEKENDD